MKNLLENIIEEKSYDDLGVWCLPNLGKFSETKTLYEYQRNALRNITKVLNLYFETEDGKKGLFEEYKKYGLDGKDFSVEKFDSKQKKQNGIVNKKFSFFLNHFKTLGDPNEEYISGSNFLNRACFWMATGSGKSLVLIKTIELLDYLQSQGLIPKKEVMLLLPREDLIRQFTKEINGYNKGREKRIELVNLKNYEDDKQGFVFNNTIKVYYYRSDLLRDERKESILDYRSYENGGNWYVFLDEAHRGGADESLLKNYVSVLSKNGFLFNYSATFTESLDYATTCFNFNLEKFINAGYGKNLYLSQSYFDFNKDKDDFSEREKQKQVLKSLIIFTLIKEARTEGTYHNPLLITLVNSINTDDADLILFFQKLEEIAGGKIDQELFDQSREEILNDFRNYRTFVFGDETLNVDLDLLGQIGQENVFKQVFNATSYGKIEILEGEKGKEIVLKLESSERPFALIKIGNAGKFQKDKLGKDYSCISSFDNKKYFENINENEDINLLLGSRSFYEGWDSNRPNVINMINIGKRDAKKYVLQGIGRGIRIEPHKGERKRLPENHVDKNALLETLFVFATDKSAVKAIVETVQEQQNKDEIEISLFENQNRPFDLLIPIYKEEEGKEKISKFSIAKKSLENFRNYLDSLENNTLLIKTAISQKDLDFLLNEIKNNNLFQIKEEKLYSDMDLLLQRIISFLSVKNRAVAGIKPVENEIIHFKQIKVINFSDEEVGALKEKINKVRDFQAIDKKEIENKIKSGEITFDEALRLGNAVSEESFKDLVIKKIAEHYYLPLIYSDIDKLEYIKHIVSVPSEVVFIKNLEKYIKDNHIESEWMFSKIDENLDKAIGMPYFTGDNFYRDFFPDFIFWIKKGDEYRIVFVDPKGVSNTDYEDKVEGFEELFLEKGNAKVFECNNYKITFELRLIAKDINKVRGEKYKKYWLGDEDYNFLK